MNFLPLVLALALMISLMTIERLEKFKNQEVVQIEYQKYLEESERKAYSAHERRLYGFYQTTHRQLPFRFFIDKQTRERDAGKTKQSRLITTEFLKTVYGNAGFYKKLEKKRPHFVDEMLDAIEQGADAMPKKSINRVEDIAFIKLDDPELQEAFYHMLKGTISRKKLLELDKKYSEETATTKKTRKSKSEKETKRIRVSLIDALPQRMKGKAYVSLLTYININEKGQAVEIQKAPRELLKAIFGNDEVVTAIINKRNELAASEDSGAAEAFKNEFLGKRRPGLDESLLDFKISSTNKSKYD